MKILHLESENYPKEAMDMLSEIGDIDIVKCKSHIDLVEILELNHYEIVILSIGSFFDSKCFQLQKKLNFLVSPTTGLNHIDLISAKKNNVKIISLKGEYDFLSNIKSTAEHTWALLLSVIKKVNLASSLTSSGIWDRDKILPNDELDNKNLGIIGFGRLAKIVLKYAEAFNMKVFANDIDDEKFDLDHLKYKHSLRTVLTKSDYLLLMISYKESNINFMNSEKFSIMKDQSFFINTSRGEMVNENDLLENLKSGKLKGAALDVLHNDSNWSQNIEGSHDLIKYSKEHNNLIITPHIGGYGNDSIRKTRIFIVKKLIKHII
jgi:D-3-phosphoglycerate dehydrogenase / 2-oxoglutarate reductase